MVPRLNGTNGINYNTLSKVDSSTNSIDNTGKESSDSEHLTKLDGYQQSNKLETTKQNPAIYNAIYNLFYVSSKSEVILHCSRTQTNNAITKDITENLNNLDKPDTVTLSSINQTDITCKFDCRGRCLYVANVNGVDRYVFGEFSESSKNVYFEKVDNANWCQVL